MTTSVLIASLVLGKSVLVADAPIEKAVGTIPYFDSIQDGHV